MGVRMSDERITFGVFRGGGDVREYPAGATIFSAGETADHLFVVRSGEVVLSAGDVELERLGEGEMFGEMAVIDGSPRSATAMAATDCVLVPVDGARFHRLVQDTPFFGESVMRLIAGRLRRMTPR